MKKKANDDRARWTRRDYDTGCGRATCKEETAAACLRDERCARAAGAALLKRMRGRGWKLHVWENLGWHYSVHSGAISVHVSRRLGGVPTYWALMSDSLPARGGVACSGAMIWSDPNHEQFADPNRAVRHQLRLAQVVVASLTRTVAATAAAAGDE